MSLHCLIFKNIIDIVSNAILCFFSYYLYIYIYIYIYIYNISNKKGAQHTSNSILLEGERAQSKYTRSVQEGHPIREKRKNTNLEILEN
jgi:cbb3-type cytochrome oxidase subunit 3